MAAVCGAALVTTIAVQGQTPAPPQPERPTFRAEISIVEVSAVVTGDNGQPVTDLTKDDFEILEDGQRRPLVSARFLSTAPSVVKPVVPPFLAGARLDEIVTNRALADAPAFVLLLDDLNVSAYDSHRAIRAARGVLDAIPGDALVSVVNSSGEGGGLITLGRPNQDHRARIEAFRGRLVLTGPDMKNPLGVATTPSSVDAPCGVGSEVLNSPDCSDPTRAGRRARALRVVGELFSRTGSRRKVLIWLTTDMGVSPLDPDGNRQAQFAGLQRLLGGDVTVYAVDPRENTGSFVAGGGGLGQADRRTGGRVRVGPASTLWSGPGGTTMTLDTDDMVGVPLTQLARDTGGRWIQNANNVEKLAGEIVTQNLSSYVVAYESAAPRTGGRHEIDVKVRRRGAKVSARRVLVAPPSAPVPTEASPAGDLVMARLRDLVQGGVPFGTLALDAQVVPQFAAAGPAKALITVRVGEETPSALSSIDVLVLVADDTGTVAAVERFAMNRPSSDVPWEGSVTLTLDRGQYQLRVAASTVDGARTGLLVHPIDVRGTSGELQLGVPTLLGENEHGVRPTLARTFPAGHPLAFQVEIAGDAVVQGRGTMLARLVDANGSEVRSHVPVTEDAGEPTLRRATGVVTTDGLAAGAYTLIIEARASAGSRPQSHAIPVRLSAGSTDPATRQGSLSARRLTPLPVAHGPLTRHARPGPQVIRSEREWKAFWLSLPTRQAAPDIDFTRVTLLAIVSDQSGSDATQPRITRVETEPGGVVVHWDMAPLPTALRNETEPPRPFVVVGLHGQQGSVRFERTP